VGEAAARRTARSSRMTLRFASQYESRHSAPAAQRATRRRRQVYRTVRARQLARCTPHRRQLARCTPGWTAWTTAGTDDSWHGRQLARCTDDTDDSWHGVLTTAGTDDSWHGRQLARCTVRIGPPTCGHLALALRPERDECDERADPSDLADLGSRQYIYVSIYLYISIYF
jgi:hypothetical protein